jgi:hypothetical protein
MALAAGRKTVVLPSAVGPSIDAPGDADDEPCYWFAVLIAASPGSGPGEDLGVLGQGLDWDRACLTKMQGHLKASLVEVGQHI